MCPHGTRPVPEEHRAAAVDLVGVAPAMKRATGPTAKGRAHPPPRPNPGCPSASSGMHLCDPGGTVGYPEATSATVARSGDLVVLRSRARGFPKPVGEVPAGPVGGPDARNRARARRGAARNAPTTGSDDMCMTDTPPPAPENPEDQHLALMTALMKIFATGRDDEDR